MDMKPYRSLGVLDMFRSVLFFLPVKLQLNTNIEKLKLKECDRSTLSGTRLDIIP